MDNTGSMGPQLKVVTSLAIVITNNLGEKTEAAMIRFVGNNKITIDQDWTSNKSELKEAFNNMFIEGGQSAVIDGVYLAAQKLLEEAKTKKDNRFAMILISDGADRNSYYNEKDIFSSIRDKDIQIFVIGLTVGLKDEGSFDHPSEKERAEKFLHRLAVRSGGTAFILNKKYTKEDLEAIIISLVTELRSPFVVGYTSTDQKHSGESRKLRVEIADGPNGEKRTAVVKNNFTVPKY
jgi:VWFA-related protein